MSARVGSALWRNFRVYQVFGANTDVGKTIFSTLLCRTIKKKKQDGHVWYLKPVSTGALSDADQGHLVRHAQGVTAQNFYQFDAAVSPHIAAGQNRVADADIVAQLSGQIKANAQHGPGWMLVETAGGPHSPAPSGTSQADLLRPLRLPTLFVADWRLGGISTSVSSFESLRMRGYDVEGVAVCKDTQYQNYEYFQDYFGRHGIPLLTLPLPPPQIESEDPSVMQSFYDKAEGGDIAEFAEQLDERHERRIERLESLAPIAYDNIWWPFAQHTMLAPERLNVIDSAYQDYFQTLSRGPLAGEASEKGRSLLGSSVDGSASWWTQGLGHANRELTAVAAYAAGRYGHVMFADSIHEPALALAEKLLATLGNERLRRVFYSDNGSTGVEVALKMAQKATSVRYGWAAGEETEILGFTNSYHGDTMGAMDMSEPSVYNKQVSWYKGRGFWFEPPSVRMQKGEWVISKPAQLEGRLGGESKFSSLAAVFDTAARDESEEAAVYEAYIRETLERLTQREKRRFGALIMEPVVLGAGGMILADPLFQRTLVKVVRASGPLFSFGKDRPEGGANDWSGLPIVADEVFTGLYRLGHRSSSAMLGVQPDVSVHAKLLTGGLIPLACTVASEAVFEATLSPSKADALLHGHSYTAHPVGCAVAVESLRQLAAQDAEGKWDAFKMDWAGGRSIGAELLGAMRELARGMAPDSGAASGGALPVWSVWSSRFVADLSHMARRVEGVWALGSVLAITLHDAQGAGYTSEAARTLQQRLLVDERGEGWNIHSRVLGNVLYLMTSQLTTEEEVRAWERRVVEAVRA